MAALAGVPTNALSAMDEVRSLLCGRRPVFFLDYDGTLSDIVEVPDEAFMTEEMRTALREVSSRFTCAIVTGRAKAKVQAFVQLESLFYAGSHGLDISGPTQWPVHCQMAQPYLPAVALALGSLRLSLAAIEGAEVEDNQFCCSVHYRNVPPGQIAEVERIVDELLRTECSGLVKRHGKMVFELRPDVKWHKGEAVLWILKTLGLHDQADVVPIYLGDDVSDEDAFEVLQHDGAIGRGIAVIVSEDPSSRPTRANYSLRNPKEVRLFLQRMGELSTQALPSSPSLGDNPLLASAAAWDGALG